MTLSPSWLSRRINSTTVPEALLQRRKRARFTRKMNAEKHTTRKPIAKTAGCMDMERPNRYSTSKKPCLSVDSRTNRRERRRSRSATRGLVWRPWGGSSQRRRACRAGSWRGVGTERPRECARPRAQQGEQACSRGFLPTRRESSRGCARGRAHSGGLSPQRRRRDIAVETSAPSLPQLRMSGMLHSCRTYGARKIIGTSQLQRWRTYGAGRPYLRRPMIPPLHANHIHRGLIGRQGHGAGTRSVDGGASELGLGSSEPGLGTSEVLRGSSEVGGGASELGLGSSEPGLGTSEVPRGSSEVGGGYFRSGWGCFGSRSCFPCKSLWLRRLS